MSEEELRRKVSDLEIQLEHKENEINKYLDRIAHLEENVMQLESCIPDEDSKLTKKQWKKGKIAKLEIELEEKDRTIRDLKDRMGYLRKEKIDFQHKFEQATKKEEHPVIRIEEKKEPFEVLIKELQVKINRQQMTISKLQEELKKEGIEALKARVLELNKKLEEFLPSDASQKGESLSKGQVKKMQKKLRKSGKKIDILEKKMEIYKQKTKKRRDGESQLLVKDLKSTIVELKQKLEDRDEKINDLEKIISRFEKIEEATPENKTLESSKSPILNLTEDLQKKLNKSRMRIRALETELEEYKNLKNADKLQFQNAHLKESGKRSGPEIPHQNQQDDQKGITQEKDNLIASNEEQLILRMKELESFVEELKKENIQQRLEISKLREK
ncbi:MAG: hypothetical protein EU539_11495 [Promethearchaeota archaeon]|nr:MAG: hypothetical protein EU539_11495 [Candidatus Lokiarchaeota archaeon]